MKATRICTVEGCDRPYSGRGYCTLHYGRWRKWGTPEPESLSNDALRARFWKRLERVGECWLWDANAPHKYGHTSHRLAPGEYIASRIAWVLASGPIPNGQFVCHHCDTPACCNPGHLFLGTAQDNATDAARKGRLVRASPHNREALATVI